ncbi:hypothetical protein [Sphingobium sp. HWE2-09]|uniref:hypothetical protein n=1 Tax=Sphingobium sp. HWE2-09 TaxID=3108390 RepID=UPI002DD2AF72|nr:hypothetical protein [Sphingobium sp. HWE2-09]
MRSVKGKADSLSIKPIRKPCSKLQPIMCCLWISDLRDKENPPINATRARRIGATLRREHQGVGQRFDIEGDDDVAGDRPYLACNHIPN